MIWVAKLGAVAVYGAQLESLPRQARGVLRLHGPDTTRFLQGTVSADLVTPPPGRAIAAALLTVKAKIVSELVLLVRAEDTIDVVIPSDRFDEVESLLDRHIIMDEVELERRSDDALAVLWGEGVEELALPPGVEGWKCSHPVHGVLCVGAPAALQEVLGSVTAADPAAFARHRIGAGVPAWGFELAPDFFPPEVGFVGAVSYDKGCYLGQEPLARIHARGQVNRVLVRVAFEGDLEAPSTLAHVERPEAGTLTTVGDGQGLAIVRRTFAVPETSLQAGTHALRVVSGPLGDDPGVGARSK